MRFPPVMNRGQLEKSGYLKSFPNLLGCVCGLHGTEREINAAVSRFDAGGDWTTSLSPADLVLSPAACYPVYPIAAARGPLPSGGLRFDVAADCFRAEPSRHLDRLQSFRMREYVCIGSPDDVSDFRERWMVRAQAIARDLGLDLQGRLRQRSVLRPRRPDEGGQPDAAIAEIRAAGSAALGSAADRMHELQLSPRPFRHDLGHQGRQAASRPIPAAWRSAWTAWRWRCSIPTAPTSRSGRSGCGNCSACRLIGGACLGARAATLSVIPGWCVAPDPESRSSPMCNCTS